jgi:hypothetical protein
VGGAQKGKKHEHGRTSAARIQSKHIAHQSRWMARIQSKHIAHQSRWMARSRVVDRGANKTLLMIRHAEQHQWMGQLCSTYTRVLS